MYHSQSTMELGRIWRGLALVAIGACLIGTPALRAAGASIPEGGTFRIVFEADDFDYIDPALAYAPQAWALLDATCAKLLNYPDKPPPHGLRLVPEVATAFPRVSSGGRTYTFTLRPGFRFSDGTPVRASAFARAIQRTLAPGMQSPGAQYTRDIVGAEDFRAGRTTAVAGVSARGNRLVVRLTRPAPDFPARTTTPFFCAVPPTLPADPEGVGAFPGSGPYYVAEYRPGQRVVIRRNRFYRGERPHHVDGFVVDVRASSDEEVLDLIERGEADWSNLGSPPAYLDPDRRLVAKYGLNRSQFFSRPGLTFRGFAFNTSRPLFRDNPSLRRAVNFAIDRAAIRRAAGGPLGGHLTDQYLPPTMPGFTNAAIYPHRPNLRRARALAAGHTRSGKALLYTLSTPVTLAHAQILKQNLAGIGLDVEIRAIPPPAYLNRLLAPDEPWDIAPHFWAADYADPFGYINVQLDGRSDRKSNLAGFDSQRYNRLMRRAARLQGRARYRAYGELDIQLARDAAPLVSVSFTNEFTLVSKRVDPRCVVLRPTLDLTAVCLKR